MNRRLAGIALLLAFSLAAAARQGTAPPVQAGPSDLRWFKGNTHTHTLNSDGDSTPDDVVRWYREHGYHFLVLTDHNFLTRVDGVNALHGALEQFIVIPGEEVSDRWGDKPIHINGLNIDRVVEPQGGATVLDMIQRNVDAVRRAAGVPHINHPNFRWAISSDELRQVENEKLFEIFNGHPRVNNLGQGAGGPPSLEEMWDAILSSGKLLYGIAVDDAHVFKRPWDRDAARPGQGWVVARTDRLTAEAVLGALERGSFYASTGVELEDYQVTKQALTVTMKEEESIKYWVVFIGKGGRVLAETTSNPAVYRFRGDELYVRAKVLDSNGRTAWLQPVMPAWP